MPTFTIKTSFYSKGLAKLKLKDTEESPFQITIKVQCTCCREDRIICLLRDTTNRVANDKHTKGRAGSSSAHRHDNTKPIAEMISKCPACKRSGTVEIFKEPFKIEIETQDNEELDGGEEEESEINVKPQPLLELELRGLTLIELHRNSYFIATSKSGISYDIGNYDEKEWYDYDEKLSSEISITSWEFQVV